MESYRYIKLTEKERAILLEIWRSGSSLRERNRAHAILLSSQGVEIAHLAKIFFVNRDSIGRWLKNWEEEGVSGLKDKDRSGRPSIFISCEKKK